MKSILINILSQLQEVQSQKKFCEITNRKSGQSLQFPIEGIAITDTDFQVAVVYQTKSEIEIRLKMHF